MRLAIFDIDGTLTLSSAVDGDCFATAFVEELGLSELDCDWSSYPHRTDAGIAAGIYRRYLRRPATGEEQQAVRQRFFRLLEQAAERSPGKLEPVPGARQLLRSLPGEGWAVCLATGGWRPSAELKLAAAGLELGLPMATSDDAVSRREIVELAIARAARCYRVEHFERMVSLGDGVWDARVASRLDLPFVGVAAESDGGSLRSAGASHVIDDYRDRAAVLAALEAAAVP